MFVSTRSVRSKLASIRCLYSTDCKFVEVKKHGDTGTAVVLLGKSPVNTLNVEFMEEFTEAVKELKSDKSVRGILVKSKFHGKVFCAGMDVTELQNRTDAQVRHLWSTFLSFAESFIACPKPIVACLNGHAIGAGCAFALMADYRVGHDQMKMGLNMVQMGIPVPLFNKLIRHSTSNRRFSELTPLTGNILTAENALQKGMVDELSPVDEITQTSMAKLRQLAQIPPLAYSLTKQLTRRNLLEKLKSSEDIDYFVATVQSERVQNIIENKLTLLRSKKS